MNPQVRGHLARWPLMIATGRFRMFCCHFVATSAPAPEAYGAATRPPDAAEAAARYRHKQAVMNTYLDIGTFKLGPLPPEAGRLKPEGPDYCLPGRSLQAPTTAAAPIRTNTTHMTRVAT